MKNLLLLILLVCVFSCREKPALTPVDIGLSGIFQELKFAGVSDNNIKLEEGRIIVNLPANYPYGNILKPSIKLREGFSFSGDTVSGFTTWYFSYWQKFRFIWLLSDCHSRNSACKSGTSRKI
jgi:hypothetical protein